MKQIIPRVIAGVSYTNPTTYWAVKSGVGQLSDTFGEHVAKTPMPWPATVRNLVVYTRDAIPVNLVLTVMKNGVATGLSVTLPAGETGPFYATGVEVDYVQFDDISYRTVTTSGRGFPGWVIGACLEVESEGNVFGLTPVFGTLNANEGQRGGALGNGVVGGYTHPTAGLSGSYSICAVDGTITTLALKAFSGGVPVGSAWNAFLTVDGVAQDGSGSTVDTRCTMTGDGSVSTAAATFALPITLGQRVDATYYRTGATSPFGTHVAMGIGFVPDEDGHFMLCGGTTDIVPAPVAYKWPYAFPDLTTELLALAPIGPSGLVARGLYVERASPAGVGETLTHTLRRNEENTLITVTISGASQTNNLLADRFRSYAQGDTISLRADATSGANSDALFWGLDAAVVGVEPEPIGEIGPYLWVEHRRIVNLD